MTSVSIRALYEEDLEGTFTVNVIGPNDLNIGKTRYLPGEKVTISGIRKNRLLEVMHIINVPKYSQSFQGDASGNYTCTYSFDMPAKDVTITLEWVIHVSIEYGGTFAPDNLGYRYNWKYATPGESYEINANFPDPANYETEFDHWEVIRGFASFDDYKNPNTNIIVNEAEDCYIWIKAMYKRTKYRVDSNITFIANEGRIEGIGHYAPGEMVTLTAIPDEGRMFRCWVPNRTTEGVVFDLITNPITFVMPEGDVEMNAAYNAV